MYARRAMWIVSLTASLGVLAGCGGRGPKPTGTPSKVDHAQVLQITKDRTWTFEEIVKILGQPTDSWGTSRFKMIWHLEPRSNNRPIYNVTMQFADLDHLESLSARLLINGEIKTHVWTLVEPATAPAETGPATLAAPAGDTISPPASR